MSCMFRAFQDSNGDGIGDFPGLISRLDYLQDLGVTCLWLLPFFPSPLRDDGYDIANYVDVNPSYGTLNDFKLFSTPLTSATCRWLIELGHQPHLRPASVVPGGTARTPRFARPRVLCLVAGQPALPRRPHHLQGHGEVQLELG